MSCVTLLWVSLLPASCCYATFLIPVLFCPTANTRPTGVCFPLPLLLSETPGVISLVFPISSCFTLYSFYQCSSHHAKIVHTTDINPQLTDMSSGRPYQDTWNERGLVVLTNSFRPRSGLLGHFAALPRWLPCRQMC